MIKYIEPNQGKRIKEIRGKTSQPDFAARLGVSLQGYLNYEYGKRIPPRPVLEKLAEISGRSIDWILTGEETGAGRSVTVKEEIGKRIKKLRGRYSLPMFAALLKISLSSLQRYECGDRIPPDSVLKHLAGITGYPVEWILTGNEDALAVRDTDQPPYLFDSEAYEILDLMQGLDEARLKGVLRYIRDQKLLSEQEKKRKAKRK